jgi:hypothetical protein
VAVPGKPPLSRRLAEIVTPGGLTEFVRARRAEGMSWRTITHALWAATNGDVDVSHETLRSWFPDTADDNGDEGAAA